MDHSAEMTGEQREYEAATAAWRTECARMETLRQQLKHVVCCGVFHASDVAERYRLNLQRAAARVALPVDVIDEPHIPAGPRRQPAIVSILASEGGH